MECATTWQFQGSRLEEAESPGQGALRQAWAAMKGTLALERVMPRGITQQTQDRVISDVRAGKLSYKPVPCSECGIELSIESFMRNEGLGNDGSPGKPRYCDICDSIVKSMAASPGLIMAHETWEADQFRKKGLIDGRA